MGEDGGERCWDVVFGGGRSDVEKDLRFKPEERARRVAAEDCATIDIGRKVAREDRSVIGSRTCGMCMSFRGDGVSVLPRKEAGTGEPEASMVMLSHAGASSLVIVVRWSAFAQPAISQPFVALLFRFSWLVAKAAS